MFSPLEEDPESSRRNNPNLPDLYKTAHIPNVTATFCDDAGDVYEHWCFIIMWPTPMKENPEADTAVKPLPTLSYN